VVQSNHDQQSQPVMAVRRAQLVAGCFPAESISLGPASIAKVAGGWGAQERRLAELGYVGRQGISIAARNRSKPDARVTGRSPTESSAPCPAPVDRPRR
jgi:hypothetical protein